MCRSVCTLTHSPESVAAGLHRAEECLVEALPHLEPLSLGIQVQDPLDPLPVLLAELELERVQWTDDLDLVLTCLTAILGEVLGLFISAAIRAVPGAELVDRQ